MKFERVLIYLIHNGHKLSDNGEFDPGSGRTLAACLTHASRTEITSVILVANG